MLCLLEDDISIHLFLLSPIFILESTITFTFNIHQKKGKALRILLLPCPFTVQHSRVFIYRTAGNESKQYSYSTFQKPTLGEMAAHVLHSISTFLHFYWLNYLIAHLLTYSVLPHSPTLTLSHAHAHATPLQCHAPSPS